MKSSVPFSDLICHHLGGHSLLFSKQILHCDYELLCMADSGYLYRVLSQFTVISIIIIENAIVNVLSN